MICSVPSLKNVTLGNALFHHCFFATLARKGKESKVQILKLHNVQCPSPASSHHLAEAMCSMPNLTDLTIRGWIFDEEFYSTLKAKASSIQVQTLDLHHFMNTSPVPSHHLAEALCYMPNLTDLTLGVLFHEEFYSALKAYASSIQGCFPQIPKGNFRFNGVAQGDLNSFLHTLPCLQSSDSDCSSDSDNSADWDSPYDSDNSADLGSSNDPDNSADLGSSKDSENLPDLGSSNDSYVLANSEGSSSRSRPCKRQPPFSESRVPQDDPGIPKKKSKYEV